MLAAERARARGDPEAAAVQLRHALDAAGSSALRGELLYRLGLCQLTLRDPRCVRNLRAALELLADPRGQALAAIALADGLLYVGDLEGSREVLMTAIARIGGDNADLVCRLEAMAAQAGYGHPRLNPAVRDEVPRLVHLADGSGSEARSLNVFLGFVASSGCDTTDQALGRVELGLENGRLLEAETSDSIAIAVAVNTLVFIDELERAELLVLAMIDDARRRGLVLGFIAASAHRGLVALRRGNLALAEAETRAALELAQQHELMFTIPFTVAYLAATLLERGALAEASAMLEEVPIPPGFERTLGGATFRNTRGRSRLANGDRAGGVDDLRGSGEALEAIGLLNPNVVGWRSELALALAREDPEGARRLAESELEMARRSGSNRAIGVALRARGLLARGKPAVAALEEAVTVLERSPARLEHARALIDFGAALRRANARTRAREPLRRGLELASRCNAAPLAARARQELLASGGRPRRIMLTGRDALTTSEHRIAELAARGDSNRAIAEALFITPKTVENHLGRVFKKLTVNSRDQLAQALVAERPIDDAP